MLMLETTMAAVGIEGGKGPASALRLHTMPVPVPRRGQVLIKVHASGVNRTDILQRVGMYPPPPGASTTLGLEVAGEVVRPAGRWRKGDKVCALLDGGGYAPYAVCDARHALPIPAGLSFIEAAGLPETVFTVFTNLLEHGALKSGETLMIHGATSGIGVTAIQIGKLLGARVIATARSAQKAQAAKSLGADIAVDSSTRNFGEVAQHEGGVDLVLDMVGASYFQGNMQALKVGGRIVYIAALGGSELPVHVLQLMQKRATITGTTLRARDADEKARIAAAVEQLVWPWISTGRFKPRVDRSYVLADASLAHDRLESGDHIGKVILTVE
jgi:putative PIG3 family NAD(P)H quinone oxidoreductase